MAGWPLEALGGVAVRDLVWLVGAWHGVHGDAPVEETWAAPLGGTMIGHFRWIRDGSPWFYELMTIAPDGSGVTLRLKHFDPDLRGWEDANAEAAKIFPLIELHGQHAVFRQAGVEPPVWMRYERTGDELGTWFERAAGPPPVADRFVYRLVPGG
jgi:hypothetical protein